MDVSYNHLTHRTVKLTLYQTLLATLLKLLQEAEENVFASSFYEARFIQIPKSLKGTTSKPASIIKKWHKIPQHNTGKLKSTALWKGLYTTTKWELFLGYKDGSTSMRKCRAGIVTEDETWGLRCWYLLWNASLNPGCSASNQAPFQCKWKSSGKWYKYMSPWHPPTWVPQMEFQALGFALGYSSPCHRSIWGPNQQLEGISVSLKIYLPF